MANLLSIFELVHRNLNPNGSVQSAIKKEEIIEAGLQEYAAAMWIFSKEEESANGGFEIPSQMLTTVELPVTDNYIDITGLNILDSLANDQWLQDVGGFNCDCVYIKSSLAQEKAMCNDDSIGNAKTFFRVGKKILFPRGVHKNKLQITYANTGIGLNPKEIECNAYVASKVRDKLYQIYGIKVPEDVTANSNSNN